MSGSASSASFENLKPHVNSSPQNRTCRVCLAPVFIARLWGRLCLTGRSLCQVSMQRTGQLRGEGPWIQVVLAGPLR